MDEEKENLRILLNSSYNKLLAYLGGGVVCFFTLFQITTELDNLNPWLVGMISGAVFIGAFFYKSRLLELERYNRI